MVFMQQGPILSAAVDGEGVLSGNELTEAVVFGSTAGTEAAGLCFG